MSVKEGWKVNGFIFVIAGLVWVGSFVLDRHFLPYFDHAPGIDLVFVPSGVRLIAVMAGGIWAALGVSFGSLFLAGREFDTGNIGNILAIAAGSGLFPYVALRAALRATGVDASLTKLTALKLPFIGLGVAIGSSVLHNLLFCALGIKPWGSLPSNVTTMATGDFTGTLLAVVIVYVILRFVRRQPA